MKYIKLVATVTMCSIINWLTNYPMFWTPTTGTVLPVQYYRYSTTSTVLLVQYYRYSTTGTEFGNYLQSL